VSVSACWLCGREYRGYGFGCCRQCRETLPALGTRAVRALWRSDIPLEGARRMSDRELRANVRNLGTVGVSWFRAKYGYAEKRESWDDWLDELVALGVMPG
jgi:hypothetical protein